MTEAHRKSAERIEDKSNCINFVYSIEIGKALAKLVNRTSSSPKIDTDDKKGKQPDGASTKRSERHTNCRKSTKGKNRTSNTNTDQCIGKQSDSLAITPRSHKKYVQKYSFKFINIESIYEDMMSFGYGKETLKYLADLYKDDSNSEEKTSITKTRANHKTNDMKSPSDMKGKQIGN